MYADRIRLYEQLEESRNSKVLVYVTGDRKQLETNIHSEVLDFFIHHLDVIGDVEKISLLLYTRGGDALASWSIVNLIRQFCNNFEVIVPFKCHSGGTLMSLGADTIVMTKQATLGPIDPSVTTPLNPSIPNTDAKIPVSVEAISGYTEFLNEQFANKKEDTANMILQLTKEVHPLVLGQAFRARSQIKMLAGKLIGKQINDQDKIDKILKFLCSESGSHDYTINRNEARDDLGLNVEKPDDELYTLIKNIYDDIASELQLTEPYDPKVLLGTNRNLNYKFIRALIESKNGGTHWYSTEGTLSSININIGQQPNIPGMPPGIQQMAIKDDRSCEGWKYEQAPEQQQPTPEQQQPSSQ